MSHKTSSAVARIVLSARLTGIYPLQVTSAGFHGGTWAYWGNFNSVGAIAIGLQLQWQNAHDEPHCADHAGRAFRRAAGAMSWPLTTGPPQARLAAKATIACSPSSFS